MTLPYNFVNILNSVVVFVYLLFIVIGYTRGLLSQLLDVVSMIASLVLAWFLAPQLAHTIPLIPSSLDWFKTPLVGDSLYQISNTVVWYVIVFIAVSVLMTFIVKPAAKTIHAIPIAKTINRILGAFFGLIVPSILAILATFVLTSPFFTNGRASVEASFLAPITEISDIALNAIVDNSASGPLLQKILDGDKITTQDFQTIPEWFAELGLPEELKVPFEKLINQEALTQDEMNAVLNYISSEGWTKEDLSNFFDNLGFSAEQIDEMINKLGIK